MSKKRYCLNKYFIIKHFCGALFGHFIMIYPLRKLLLGVENFFWEFSSSYGHPSAISPPPSTIPNHSPFSSQCTTSHYKK